MDRVAALDDPQLRPFLPLLYVAWADGDLEDEERLALLARLADQPWVRPAARQSLARWLAVDAPPSDDELQRLLGLLRTIAGTLGSEARNSLAALAEELAAPEARAPVAEIAQTLGVDGLAPPAPTVAPVPEAALDPRVLTAMLDGPHAAVRARVRDFLAEPGRRAYGLPDGEYRALVAGWLRELADRGFGKLAYPGVTCEGDLQPFMVAFETLALGDLSLLVKYGVQFGLFGGSVLFLGSERHRALLPDVASLAMPGCFAMSEIGHGSNVAELETIARYDAGELVVHTPSESARKEWIGGAARDARWATVFAQLEVAGTQHGVHAILVPIRDEAGNLLPGVRAGDCGHKMGLNGVDNGRLWFDHVRVPVANLLDRFARIDETGAYQSDITSPGKRFFTMLATLVGGRVAVGSAAVSAAKVGLAIAVRYATARRQFGPAERELTLMEYPTHQRRLIPALATTYVLSFAFEQLRQRYASATGDTRELEAEVAALKAMATTHATRTLQDCREACGGQGYLAVNRLPDLKADADVFTTFEGDNTVLLQLVAKSLLTGYKRTFEATGWAGVVRRTLEDVWDKNPVAVRRRTSDHLRNSTYLYEMLTHRKEALVGSAALRLRKRLKQGVKPEVAFLEVQEHLVAAAQAYGDLLAHSLYISELVKHAGSPASLHVHNLGDLFALSRIEAHLGWYLEHGWVEPAKAKAIRNEVEVLCREIAPAARALVDGFGIPDACLAAPIAFFDPAHPRYA